MEKLLVSGFMLVAIIVSLFAFSQLDFEAQEQILNATIRKFPKVLWVGFTLGTFIPNFPTVEENQVRLPNRARPLNPFFKQKIRVPRSDLIGRLDVPNPPALTKIAKSHTLSSLTRIGFVERRI